MMHLWNRTQNRKSEVDFRLIHGADRASGQIQNNDSRSRKNGEEQECAAEQQGGICLNKAARKRFLKDREGSILRLHGDAGFLHAAYHGGIERGIGLDLSHQDVVFHGEFVEFKGLGLLLLEGCLEFGDILGGDVVLDYDVVSGICHGLGERQFERVDPVHRRDVFRMLGEVAFLVGCQFGLCLVDLLVQGGNPGKGGDAGNLEQFLGAGGIRAPEEFQVRFRLEFLILGGGDGGAELVEFFHDDVLVLLEGDGIVLLLVFLQGMFGILELFLEFHGLVAEEFVGRMGDLGALPVDLLQELPDHGGGERAGHGRVPVGHADLDEARALAQVGIHL